MLRGQTNSKTIWKLIWDTKTHKTMLKTKYTCECRRRKNWSGRAAQEKYFEWITSPINSKSLANTNRKNSKNTTPPGVMVKVIKTKWKSTCSNRHRKRIGIQIFERQGTSHQKLWRPLDNTRKSESACSKAPWKNIIKTTPNHTN